MSTLLLRLAAPLQSWGVGAKFDRRGTERVPTKSGVLGLAAAALGIRRGDDESLKALCGLRFGARVDREGTLLRDYHTAKSAKAPYVTNRYYLADAVFLAGLEGNEILLLRIDAALRTPAFPLFLGRRSCPPEGRVSLGIREGKDLFTALSGEPRLVENRTGKREESAPRLRIVMDAGAEQGAYFQRDLPLSLSPVHRKFGFRHVCETYVSAPDPDFAPALEPPTGHDAMSAL